MDHETPPAAAPRWASYIALGDSITEGLWDPYPHRSDQQRGWADLLAAHLSYRRNAAGLAPISYANLAIRGRKLPTILAEQLPRALDMGPELVSLIGGGNDILRPGTEVNRLADQLEAAVVQLRAAGIDVLVSTGFDAAGSPLMSRTRGKVGIYNSLIWSMARRHGALVLDAWGLRCLRDWRMWADDRAHPSPEGHRRLAQAALVALGLPPSDPHWAEPLPARPPVSRWAQTRADAAWMRDHLGPWVLRRIQGRSSGDGRSPSWPHLALFPGDEVAGEYPQAQRPAA